MLKQIAQATEWSQEELAGKLSVSFPTLNSWINGKSTPRSSASKKIEALYLDVVGLDTVDQSVLNETKSASTHLKLSVKDIVGNSKLLDRLTLYLTYHTNTIEGSTMTLSDVEEVLFDNKVLSNRTAIEQAEARNHQATLHWLLDQLNQRGNEFKIDEALIKDIHVRLMNGIVSDAGVYRKHSVRLMGSRVPLTNWQRIPDALQELVSREDTDAKDLIRDLAQFHANFEQIHPFSDGNGRTGRLLMLVQALHAGLVPPVVEKERKRAYYKYLELAQTNQKYENLELFIAESIVYANGILTGSSK